MGRMRRVLWDDRHTLALQDWLLLSPEPRAYPSLQASKLEGGVHLVLYPSTISFSGQASWVLAWASLQLVAVEVGFVFKRISNQKW